MNDIQLNAIRKFEGFSARGIWDFKQTTNGYGTRAKYIGEVVDKAEAEQRFRAEIGEARASVVRFSPDLDEGSVAALTSLTFNAGSAWMTDGLGAAVRAGDLDEARRIFVQYIHAGGKPLPGLVTRRAVEVQWFGGGCGTSGEAGRADHPGSAAINNVLPGQARGSAGRGAPSSDGGNVAGSSAGDFYGAFNSEPYALASERSSHRPDWPDSGSAVSTAAAEWPMQVFGRLLYEVFTYMASASPARTRAEALPDGVAAGVGVSTTADIDGDARVPVLRKTT